jgi:hypothetical protein
MATFRDIFYSVRLITAISCIEMKSVSGVVDVSSEHQLVLLQPCSSLHLIKSYKNVGGACESTEDHENREIRLSV